MAENGQPIIVKKVKKVSGGGHHGGSWKVAYADFVTAMMAFFLLLWLLSASNTSTLEGIASYFQNPSMVQAAGGASTSVIKIGSHVDAAKGEGDRNRESEELNNNTPSYSKEFQEFEMRQLEDLKDELQYEIDNSAALKMFKDQLLIDITKDGLRIQIVDKDKRPMFDLGSAEMKWYAKKILKQFAPILNKVPNKISLSGHTDSKQYERADGYTNWELSSDRANAARRELVIGSYPADKISRITGLAEKVMFNSAKPNDPINRRISIVVLKKEAEDEIMRENGYDEPSISEPIIFTPKEFGDALREGTVRRSGAIIRSN